MLGKLFGAQENFGRGYDLCLPQWNMIIKLDFEHVLFFPRKNDSSQSRMKKISFYENIDKNKKLMRILLNNENLI